MADDNEQAAGPARGEEDGGRAPIMKNQRKGQRGQHGPGRDPAGGEDHDHENSERAERGLSIQHQVDAEPGGHSLSSPEPKIHGEDVPEKRSEAGQAGSYRIPQHPPASPSGERSLEDIQDQGYHPGAWTQRSGHIGGAYVTAARAANVGAVEDFAKQQAAGDSSRQVSGHKDSSP